MTAANPVTGLPELDIDESVQKIGPYLLHYTSVAGLDGVIKSSSLRATHYEHLNDPSEVSFGLDQLKDLYLTSVRSYVPEIVRRHSGARAADIERDISKSWEWFSDRIKREPGYITSFAAHKDPYEQQEGSLSHWNFYGIDGGYAIEFDTEKLAPFPQWLAKRSPLRFGLLAPVQYGISTSQPWYDRIFQRYIGAYYNSTTMTTDDYFPLLHLAYKFGFVSKSRAFWREEEVRLVVAPCVKEESQTDDITARLSIPIETSFRGGSLWPYIVLASRPYHLAITRVIVGPHPNAEARGRAVEKLLSLNGRNDVIVHLSATNLVVGH